MKTFSVIVRVGYVGLMVLWMAACSGGGGQSENDLATNRQTAVKGGTIASPDPTPHETHDGDQADNSDGHHDSNTNEHDAGHGSDHASDQGNNETDQSSADDQSDDTENSADDEAFPIVTVADQQQQIRTVYQPNVSRFLAVWNTFREDSGWGISARVVNSQGGPHGPLKAISPAGAEHRTPPGIAHDSGTGRSLVVWGTAEGDVLARLIDEGGDVSSPVIPVASSAAGEVEPSVAFETTSAHYLVVWIETSPSFALYSRVIDREGLFVGDAAPISEAASGKLDLRLAADHDTGRFLVVWRDYRGQDIYSIFGRMIGPDGLPTSDEIVIADAAGSQIAPEVAYDANAHSFFVTWSDSRRSGSYELYGQVVTSPDGLLVGSNVPLSLDGGYSHAIEVDPQRSRYLVVYSKGNRRLYARYFAPDGVAEGGEFSLSINEALQSSPYMAVDSNGGILAAWTDEREGAPHLFGRTVTASAPDSPPACSGLSTPDGHCLDCEADAGALVDLACPVDTPYENHGAYLACVTDAVNALRHEGRIGGACKVKLIAPRARSGVGH